MPKEPSTLLGQYARLQLQAVSRLFSIFIVGFLASLVLLALFRMFTGISIKRFGYLSICGISFRTRKGNQIKIGKVGLIVHRPTVARPGWFELSIKNCEIRLSKTAAQEHAKNTQETSKSGKRKPNYSSSEASGNHFSQLFEQEIKSIPLLPKSQVWLRRAVKWLIPALKVINVSFNSLLVQAGAGTYIVSSVSLRLDLRNLKPLRNSNFVGTLDAYKLKKTEIRAAFKVSLTEFYVAESLDDENPHPILDTFGFDMSGVLDKKSLELKELTFDVSVQNMHIQLEYFLKRLKQEQGPRAQGENVAEASPKHHTLSRSQRVQLAKIGIAIVYLVKEIDFKINSFELTKIPSPQPAFDKDDNPAYLIMSMSDVGFNIRRMNPKSPGFKLLYSDSPAAHQAFLKVSSVNFGIDAGTQEELLYIPLISLIFQTNMASNTLKYVQDDNAKLNNSIINGALNVNSPTVNFETHHLPILLQMLKRKHPKKTAHKKSSSLMGLYVPPEVQNALPKADFSMHVSDAALRLVFDGEKNPNSMFITSCSRIHSQLVGDHTMVNGEQVYSLEQDFEVIKGQVWYTSDHVPRFTISSSELLKFNMNAVSQPQLTVDFVLKLANVNHNLTRFEIFHAIRCLTETIRPPHHVDDEDITLDESAAAAAGRSSAASRVVKKPVEDATNSHDGKQLKPSPLRKLPAWLRSVKLDAKDLTVALASERFRGQTSDLAGVHTEVASIEIEYAAGELRDKSTDGRRLQIDVDGTSFASITSVHVERPQHQEKTMITKPWFKLPQFKCALATCIVEKEHCVTASFLVPKIYATYSMHVLLAISVVREVIDYSYGRDMLPPKTAKAKKLPHEKLEIKTTLGYANLKAHLPNNESIMLTINKGIIEYFPSSGLPRIDADSIKLYSLHPFNSAAWCAIMCLNKPEVLYRIKPQENEDQISVNVESFRVNVPFEFKLYRIIDNTITFVKAMRQLMKQTKQIDPKFILQPHEAPDPKIPKVGVKAKSLALTLEDDPFESDLGLIFQCQRHEFEARIHKELLFERYVKEVLRRDGMELIDKYAEKIATKLLERSATTSDSEKLTHPKDNSHPLKHSFTEQFMKHGHLGHNNTGQKKCNFTNGMFKKGTTSKSHKLKGSIISSLKSGSDKEEVARNLRRRIQRLLETRMDLLSSEHGTSEITNGWSDLWTSPDFYPWRQLKLPLTLLEDQGVLSHIEEDFADKERETYITLAEARERLLKHYTQSWIRTIVDAKTTQHAGVKKTEEVNFPDYADEQTCKDEIVVGFSPRPLLFKAQFSEVYWKIRHSKFETNDKLRDWMHKIGKGLPKDLKFSIFVPLYFDVQAKGGFDLRLRDYPLPVLNFPALSAMQDPENGPALAIAGNFIITEQLSPSIAQIRPLFVPLFPDKPNRSYSSDREPSWAVLEVHRTIAPVKMFTDLKFKCNSDLPTRFTWCSSYKPAFQNMQNGFAQFSKPPIDISPLMGFWDKIRLVFHARLNFNLGKSSLFFLCKGLRDPYTLTRGGSGFAFVWEKNVTVQINGSDNPKQLFVVNADVFKIVVPQYNVWERDFMSRLPGERSFPPRPDIKAMSMPENSKVVMKLSNSTEWTLGMMFQRKVDEERKKTKYLLERDQEFKPHWTVQLSLPKYVEDKDTYDAYHGFRSDYVFLSINVRSLESMGEPGGVNSVHLTPTVLRHFKTWKDQFKNSLWPPTRSGKLFPGETPKKTKLGSVLSGHQYQLALEPLYLSFTARHLSHNNKNQVIAGAKARIDRFILDLHTRKEPIGNHKRWATKLFKGEVTASHTEIRVMSANSHDSTVRTARRMKSDADMQSMFSGSSHTGSGSRSSALPSIFTNDKSQRGRSMHNDWDDHDDVTDIIHTTLNHDKTKVHFEPFVYTTFLSYIKQTDRSGSDYGEVDGEQYIKFGHEVVHDCLIEDNTPWLHHLHMLEARRKVLDDIMEDHKTSLEALEEDQTRFPGHKSLQDAFDSINTAMDVCQASIDVVDRTLADLKKCNNHLPAEMAQGDLAGIFADSGDLDKFLNLVTVHSVNVKWNNNVRDLVLRLKVLHAYTQESVYTRSRRALKYLEDLVEELDARSHTDHTQFDLNDEQVRAAVSNIMGDGHEDSEELAGHDENHPHLAHLQAILPHIKSDGHHPDEASHHESSGHKSGRGKEQSAIDHFKTFKENMAHVKKHETAENSLQVRLITPQIQIVSNKNPNKCVQVTGRAIELRSVKVYDCCDEDTDFDAAEIETRYGIVLDEANAFVFTKEDMANDAVSSLCSSGYITDTVQPPIGAVPWPPWLGIEFCLDPGVLRRFLLAPKVNLCVRYIQLNEQHVESESTANSVSDNESESEFVSENFDETDSTQHKNSRFSKLIVDSPNINFQCDSTQYYTVYTIGKDLLHYTDPLIEETEKATQRVALGIDIASNYRNSLEQVRTQQRNLNMIVKLMDNISSQMVFRNADENLEQALVKLELEFRRASLDLIVTMRAFKSALRKSNKTDTSNILYSILRFDEVLLTTLDDTGKPFMEMSLLKTGYRNFKRGEQFSHTMINSGLLQAWNLLNKAVYPDIVTPHGHFDPHSPFVSLEWTTLDPVGGIPVVEDVKVDIRPIKVQLERTLYDTLHEFFFPHEDENDSRAKVAELEEKKELEGSDSSYMSDDSESEPESKGNKTLSKGFLGGLIKRKVRHRTELHDLVDRAENFMTLTQFLVKETEIVASYKGTSSSNFLDVQEIAIKIPELVYRNKLWTKQDLFNRLKKDMIKIVLNHTGQILSNKFTLHHSAKRHVTNRITHNNALEKLERVGSHSSQLSEFGPDAASSIMASRRGSKALALTPAEWSQEKHKDNNVNRRSTLIHPRHRNTESGSTPKRSSGSFFRPSTSRDTSDTRDTQDTQKPKSHKMRGFIDKLKHI